jgi:hypothetical protein
MSAIVEEAGGYVRVSCVLLGWVNTCLLRSNVMGERLVSLLARYVLTYLENQRLLLFHINVNYLTTFLFFSIPKKEAVSPKRL